MTSLRRSVRFVLVAGAISAVAVVMAAIATPATPVTIVKVTLTDLSTTFSPKTPPPVAIRFVITNKGKKSHALTIAKRKSTTVRPGGTGRLDVGFTVGGKYPYKVTNGGKGGTLVIKAVPSSGGATSGNTTAGKAVFKTNCGSCHVLKAAGTSGTVGPNLDTVKPSLSVITQQVMHGGRFMPPFQGQLTDTQIRDVAAFVYASEHT